jgi:APA family basic amino acid/polyamine antiporter
VGLLKFAGVMVPSTTASQEGLHRGLTRGHALAIVVGSVVGTGIYMRPASIAQLVGSPLLIITVWVGAGLLSLAGALTYAELAARIPRSGGEYAFLRVTMGELPAFLFGWMRLTVGVAPVAYQAVAVTVFLSDLIPLGPSWLHIGIPWRPHPILIEFGSRQLIGVLVIAGLAILNIRGVGKAGRFQSWVTTVKVLGLLGLISAVVILGHAHSTTNYATSRDVSATPIGASIYSMALLAGVAAYNGWAHVAMVGGEVQNPGRNLPWALVAGILIVIGLYVAVNIAYLYALPMADILTANSTAHPTSTSVASRAAVAALGPRVGSVLPLLFMVSALGAVHCNMLAVPRVFFSMARDGLLPQGLGRVSSTARTPAVAIIAFACLGSTLAVLGTYDRLSNIAAFGYILFYALNAAGLLWWRRRDLKSDGFPRRHRRWVPVLFLGGTLWLIATLIVRGNVEILAALAVIGAGLPVFAYMRYRRDYSSSA